MTKSEDFMNDEFMVGFSDGHTKEKVFDPLYYWTPKQKDNYRRGFDAARKERGIR